MSAKYYHGTMTEHTVTISEVYQNSAFPTYFTPTSQLKMPKPFAWEPDPPPKLCAVPARNMHVPHLSRAGYSLAWGEFDSPLESCDHNDEMRNITLVEEHCARIHGALRNGVCTHVSSEHLA